MTGDPEQEFDPYTYIWIYTYPEIAVQNPEIQLNFQHILQFDNFENENNNLLDQQIPQKKRGRPPGSKNKTESWKNYIASEWKPPRNIISGQDSDAVSSRTRSKQHVDVE